MDEDSLFAAALALPTDSRWKLIELLDLSLERDEVLEIPPAWRAEIERRWQAHLEGKEKSHPTDEVMAAIRNRQPKTT